MPHDSTTLTPRPEQPLSEPGMREVSLSGTRGKGKATAGIYEIRNIVNGKSYIGSSQNIERRWQAHQWHALHNKHQNAHMQASWNKHGADAFAWEVLEIVEDLALLHVREQFHMDRQRAEGILLYNHGDAAYSAMRGQHPAPETLAKLCAAHTPERRAASSARHKGNTYCKGRTLTLEHRARIGAASKGKIATPETRAKISAAQIGKIITSEARARTSAANTGRHHTPEARARISAAQTGRHYTLEHCAAISAALKGKLRGPLTPEQCAAISARLKGNTHTRGHIHTDEARAKISAALTGRPWTPAQRAGMSMGMTGKLHTPETRAKMSDAQIGKIITPETRAKMSAAAKGRSLTPEHRAALKGNTNAKGHILTDEARAKISAAGKGSTHNKGRIHTPESRAANSAAQLKYWATKREQHLPGGAE